MSDIKLFQVSSGNFNELEGTATPLERSLQTQFEQNLETLLGVRFLASDLRPRTVAEWTRWGSTRTATR